MLRRFRWRTPVFLNTGSVARDHLASERTFLAWIRTGLGFVALGIAIERFSQLDIREILQPPESRRRRGGVDDADDDDGREQDKEQSQLLVGALMGLGSGSIVYGTARYFSNLRLLERGQFKPAYHGAAVLAAGVASLAGGVYGSAVRRSQRRHRERDDMSTAG
ncbi:inner membrane protein YidH [Phialemonium atrogriseum]|uniref:Inner membrane protein YidH n=1 Tax=Phialemonium atrogriseum TaxID=1093897 RepID=A0AAJ0C1E9_9PEZI|nr:inner membrane protein YidH [Phialemonium atrogriseum]KAK1768368.1 inner membrane protein YidH [Phialemonium atrogriseum]